MITLLLIAWHMLMINKSIPKQCTIIKVNHYRKR